MVAMMRPVLSIDGISDLAMRYDTRAGRWRTPPSFGSLAPQDAGEANKNGRETRTQLV